MSKSFVSEKDELLAWKAPARPFKKRDREFYLTALTLAFLLIVISFFLKEWLLIGSILAVVFVSYTLATVPPTIIKNKITKKGIWVNDTFYKYDEIREYWFETQLESDVLILLLQDDGSRVGVVVPKEKKTRIEKLLREKVVFREKPLKSLVDRFAGWMKKKVPFEEREPSQ